MDVQLQVILYYRVTTASGRKFTSPTLDQAKAEAQGEDALATPIFAEAHRQTSLGRKSATAAPLAFDFRGLWLLDRKGAKS